MVCALGIYRMAQSTYAADADPQNSAWGVSVLANGWSLPRGLVIAALTGDVSKVEVEFDEESESITLIRLAPWEDLCLDATDALTVIGMQGAVGATSEDAVKLTTKFTSPSVVNARPDTVIAQVLNCALEESLRPDLGIELLYLCRAIATGGRVQWEAEHSETLKCFHEWFACSNPVWGYIEEVKYA